MQGRLEHELKYKKLIQNLLIDLPDYVGDYYYVIQSSCEPGTCFQYIEKIKHCLTFVGTDLNKITDRKMGEYFESIKYIDKNGIIKSSSFSYRKMIWTVLNRFFIYLVNTERIEKNPMINIKRPQKQDNIERRFLTVQDLNNMLETVGKDANTEKRKMYRHRDYLILYLLMNTGMRNTALTEINVEDIDFENNKLTVVEKRNKIQEYYLTKNMKLVIKRWLRVREKITNQKTGPLFIYEHGGVIGRINDKKVRALVSKYSKDALGYAITPHKLRSAFVSLTYEASNHDIEATRLAVGHSNVATTSRYIVQQNSARNIALNHMSNNLKI